MSDEASVLRAHLEAVRAENRQLYVELSRLRQIDVWLQSWAKLYDEDKDIHKVILDMLYEYRKSLFDGTSLPVREIWTD